MPNTYTRLARINLSSNSPTVIFQNIPQTYTDLLFIGSTRTDRGTFGVDELLVQFNGDTNGSNYSHTFIRAQGAGGPDSQRVTNNFVWGPGGTATVNTANVYGNSQMYIPDYTGNRFKTTVTEIVSEGNATTNVYMMLDAGVWRNTAAITSVAFIQQGTTYIANTTMTLYGINKTA